MSVIEPNTNTSSTISPQPTDTQSRRLKFVWLEITHKCQLSCVHCYAESGPSRDNGMMTRADWERVITEGAALGVERVQFIGGEPTIHSDICTLIATAADAGLSVELFSNLVHIRPEVWETVLRYNVSMATSYYSDDQPNMLPSLGSVTAMPRQAVTSLQRSIVASLSAWASRAFRKANASPKLSSSSNRWVSLRSMSIIFAKSGEHAAMHQQTSKHSAGTADKASLPYRLKAMSGHASSRAGYLLATC